MPNVIRGERGLLALESFTGPGTYDSGAGFTHTTKIGRVDEALVEVDDAQWDARVDSKSNGDVVVKVYSADTAGTEAPDDTDLSGDNFTLFSGRL